MKGKKNKKEEELPDVCAVCRGNTWDNELYEQLKCIGCEVTCHKNCYAPEHKDRHKNGFRCDPCKKRHSKGRDKKQQRSAPRYSCSHCESPSGILKQLPGQEWMHVLCALTSSRVHLVSYSSLTFSIEAPQSKINKAFKCNFCKSQKGEGLRCGIKDCKNYSHLSCVVDNTGIYQTDDSYESIMTIGLLDKNEGSLRNRLIGRKDFPGLTFILKDKNNYKKNLTYLICQEHNTSGTFLWCTCNSLKQQSQDMIQCESCKRWYHDSCLTGPAKQICKGCRQDDIFIKYMKLPELINQAVKIQKDTNFTKFNIRFLDHFCLKLSDSIQKIIQVPKNTFEIQRYFLRQHLEQFSTEELEDEKISAEVLQILHYLIRKEAKRQQQILPEHLEEMITELSGKGKFQWKQKIQKSEKKYKDFVISKLKKIQKDPIRQIRSKLVQFAKNNKELTRSTREIAAQIKAITDMSSNSGTWLTLFANDEVKDEDHLIEFFCESGLKLVQIQQILESIKRLLQVKKSGTMDEAQYEDIVLKKYPSLSAQKQKSLKLIYANLAKDIKLRKIFQTKKYQLQELQTDYSTCAPSERISIRDKATKNNIIIPKSSQMFKIEKRSIELQINKRIFNNRYCPPDTNRLHEACAVIANIMGLDMQIGKLSKQERSNYEMLHQKYTFYQSMILYLLGFKNQEMGMGMGMSMGMGMGMVAMPYRGVAIHPHFLPQESMEPKSQEKLQQKLKQTLEEWPNTLNATEFALNILTLSSKKQVCWTAIQTELLRNFFSLMVSKIDKLIKEGLFTMKSQVLISIRQISQNLGMSEQYETYSELYELYAQWKQDLETNFGDIEAVLQDADKCRALIQAVEQKLTQQEQISQVIDVSSEIKKLKIMKIWAHFSLKFLVADRSITIAAIQTIRNNMEKIHYPQNTLRRQIERLEQQGRSLNKRITRFLQKSKIADLQFYEQLKFIKSKMTLTEARQLQKDLQKSDLDVELELNELIQEIKNVDSFPEYVGEYSKKCRSLAEVSQLRRQLLDSPFIVCQLDEYQVLLRRYYALKCSEPCQNYTKKEYFRMLNHGGAKGVQLLTKTNSLHTTYKDIETAQKQLLSLTARQKFQHPLPPEFRRIRHQLSCDPTQLSRVQRYYIQMNKLKHMFNQLKEEKADIERFMTLQAQLTKLPINTVEIVSEITRMKKQIEDMVSKARPYLPILGDNQGITYYSPFTENLLSKYQRLGARCQYMDRFENIVTKMRQIAQMSRIINFDNYKPFNVLCQRAGELINNDEFYKLRQDAFTKIAPAFIESQVVLFEVGLALLAQGGYLMRRPGTANRLIESIAKINSKFIYWERALPTGIVRQEYKDSEEDDEDDLEEDEQGIDSLGDQEDYDSELDVDQNEQILSSGDINQEQGSSSSNGGSGKQAKNKIKRSRPLEVEIISDDD